MWKKYIALCYILFIGVTAPVLGAETTASISVNPLTLAQITDFSITPAFASQNQFIDFSVTVENIGNRPLNASAVINITDSLNNTISNLTSSNVPILVGNDATFILPWNTNGYPLGDYKGVVVVYYDGNSTPPAETPFKIQAVTPPPTGGGPPGPPPPTPPEELIPPEELLPELPPLVPPEEQPLGETRIRFVKYPVIEEIRPGETTTADILVSNIGDADLTPLSIEIKGVPREWVEVRTEDIELKAGGLEGINMGFSVPAGAFPGNYRVTVILKSEESEARTFFILRVKPYPVELERPSVTRRVVVDARQGTSTITLKVENAGRFIRRLEIVEDIPKDIASHVNQVDFGVPPSEIIESDPVIRWTLEDIDFYETRSVTYEVPKALAEYSPYVNWPLRQLNIFYTVAPPREEVEISKVETSTLSPGKSGNISVIATNLGRVPLNVTLTVGLPSGWEVEPENITLRFNPSEEKVLSFTVLPPESATLGVYTATLKLTYNGEGATKDVSIFVREPSPEESPIMLWILSVLLIIILVLIFYLGRRIYKKRRKVYREEVVSTVHRLEEEIMKGK